VSDLLRSTAGADTAFTFGPVTRGPGGDPIDLTATGIQLWFTARRAFNAAPLVEKTYGVTGGAGGITVNDPATTAKNMLTVAVASADTAALTRTTDVVYDVWLREPSGRNSEIFAGEWQLRARATIPS
jgi:hypothetical protein